MLDFRISSSNSALRKVLIRLPYPLEVMLTCVRRYVAYPLSLRHIEEMMQERGVFVDYTTVHRWAIKMLPVLAAVCRRRKRPVGLSWRMDETYIKVAGQWRYLYRAVDRAVEVPPLTGHFDIGLVHPPTQTNGSFAPPENSGQHRQHFDCPSMHRGVVDKYAALLHHFFHMPQAQRVGHVPAHAREHHFKRICLLY